MQSTIVPAAQTNTLGRPDRAINIALWILQGLLAAAFLAHGWFMVAPPADMVAMINAQLGAGLRIFIGVAEVLAAAGLILPGVTRILPGLTALAAAGLMIVMGSAVILHLSRGESASAITTAVLLALVTTVAYTRWKVVPLARRKRAWRAWSAAIRDWRLGGVHSPPQSLVPHPEYLSWKCASHRLPRRPSAPRSAACAPRAQVARPAPESSSPARYPYMRMGFRRPPHPRPAHRARPACAAHRAC